MDGSHYFDWHLLGIWMCDVATLRPIGQFVQKVGTGTVWTLAMAIAQSIPKFFPASSLKLPLDVLACVCVSLA